MYKSTAKWEFQLFMFCHSCKIPAVRAYFLARLSKYAYNRNRSKLLFLHFCTTGFYSQLSCEEAELFPLSFV